MNVIWHPRAEKAKDKIADYIHWRFGDKHMEKFMMEVDETARMLMQNPNLGSIDPLFINRAKTYRSIIIKGLSKMVYYIANDTIHIAAFWDTRREPKAEAERVKE